MRVSTNVRRMESSDANDAVRPRGKYIVKCLKPRTTEKKPGLLILKFVYVDVIAISKKTTDEVETLKESIIGEEFTQFESLNIKDDWSESFRKDRERHISSMLTAFRVEVEEDGSFELEDLDGKEVVVIQVPRADDLGVTRDNIQEYLPE